MALAFGPVRWPSYLRLTRWLDDRTLVTVVVSLLVAVSVFAGAWRDSLRQDRLIEDMQHQLVLELARAERIHVAMQAEIEQMKRDIATLKEGQEK